MNGKSIHLYPSFPPSFTRLRNAFIRMKRQNQQYKKNKCTQLHHNAHNCLLLAPHTHIHTHTRRQYDDALPCALSRIMSNIPVLHDNVRRLPPACHTAPVLHLHTNYENSSVISLNENLYFYFTWSGATFEVTPSITQIWLETFL